MSYVSILSYASQPKGLPIVQNFTVPTDSTSQALLVSGSAWSGSANDTLQIQVLVGATVVTTMQCYCNPSTTHRTFPAALISLDALNLVPGDTYTLTLREVDGGSTTTDQNDYFSAMLLA